LGFIWLLKMKIGEKCKSQFHFLFYATKGWQSCTGIC
jgi:hypothetical protein